MWVSIIRLEAIVFYIEFISGGQEPGKNPQQHLKSEKITSQVHRCMLISSLRIVS